MGAPRDHPVKSVSRQPNIYSYADAGDAVLTHLNSAAEAKVMEGTIIDLRTIRDALSRGGWLAYRHLATTCRAAGWAK